MAGYALYRVYKILAMRDGAVFKTAHVESVWLPLTHRTPEEEQAIVRAYKGDILGSPDPKDYVFGVKDRHPRFNYQIVSNLRQNNPELSEFTDDQIYNAYDHWSVSEDHPDESKIVEWVDYK